MESVNGCPKFIRELFYDIPASPPRNAGSFQAVLASITGPIQKSDTKIARDIRAKKKLQLAVWKDHALTSHFLRNVV